MSKILGLDLGTNSIGWAITEQEDSIYKLLDGGVDVFQEGVNRVKGNEKPAVQERTIARASRRHFFRRRLRKIELLKILIEEKMCPPLRPEQLNAWRYKRQYPMDEAFLAWQRTDERCDKNPYHDRYLALTSSLDLSKEHDRFILGRAFYHLVQRRGFLSNRKDSANDKETGPVKESIRLLEEKIKESGSEYLGEYFYKLYQSGQKIRGQHVSRKRHYETEFFAICRKQNLPESLEHALYKAIFYQRPLKSQKGLVGTCTYERGKPRCPVSHPRFEEYRMLQFLNNIKIRTPKDEILRPLTPEERKLAETCFYRKSKVQFDFEDIAKKLSGGKKNTYAYIGDRKSTAYQFNFPMEYTVSGCPITAGLKAIFGEEWLEAICSLYMKSDGKTEEQILNDVWHSLFSFDDDNCLREWAKSNLQLSDEQAIQFLKIEIKQGYASLSLNAINKILPYLRNGYRYDEAVFMANLPAIIPAAIWKDFGSRTELERDICAVLNDFETNPTNRRRTKAQCISEMLLEKYGISPGASAKLYHPSETEVYVSAEQNENGIFQLGSPRTSAIRNPMAMRALFRLRALVNHLLKEGKIDRTTKINIEFARELNDANMRAAIARYNREQEALRADYAKKIKEEGICPTEDDILKYQLWEEQKHICLYTGETINLSDFIGANPNYDIEHTVPRSRGGDNSQRNKTLCQSRYNREVKRGSLPWELSDHEDIMVRVEATGWEENIKLLDKRIQSKKKDAAAAATKEAKDKAIQERHYLRMKRDYLADKLRRFTLKEVPEGFSRRQGVDIGIIGRYGRMYLQTVFDRVYTIKGATTADFRKMWGLQEEFTAKERTNHVHHFIDAVTIACIGSGAYAKWAQFQEDTERYDWHRGRKPVVEKPWPTFVEEVKKEAVSLLVSHHTPDNMGKQGKKKLAVRGKIKKNENGDILYQRGDTARGILHKETYYGAIERDGEIKYVVRKLLGNLKENEEKNIVDDAVRQCVMDAVKKEGFKEAMSKPICFNAEKGVFIKKVRVYINPTITPSIRLKTQRDLSKFEYKRDYHVTNDGNYCMAIYEGTDSQGKSSRSFDIKKIIDAAAFFNGKTSNEFGLVPQAKDGLPLKYILKIGTMVLFYEQSPEELQSCSTAELSQRLYKVTGMSTSIKQKKYDYGMLSLLHHQEARSPFELKGKNGEWKKGEEYRPKIVLSHKQFKAMVEGYDFELTVAGELRFKNK